MSVVVVHHDLPIARRLKDKRDGLTVIDASDPEDVNENLENADIFVVNPGSWTDEYARLLNDGDWVQATSVGYDVFPVEDFEERGVVFTNAAGNYAPVVAEHVFGLAFTFSRKIPTLLEYQANKNWDRSIGLEITDWAERRMTILGLGNIGEAIASRALSFDMEVIGIKRNPARYDGCLPHERVTTPEEMQGYLPKTELLVICVPLTDETHHMIDMSVFRALPSTAVVINVARGPVVDEPALIEALEGGHISGAGLDVFETEPLPQSSPLWHRDDVLVTPHVGGRSNRFPDRFASLFLENYDRWKKGQSLRNQIVS